MKQVHLTLVAIIRDQEHYVKEWLTFHYLVGVERFVIVLHRCSDRTAERIRELPFRDKIHLYVPANDDNFLAEQWRTYQWAIRDFGQFTKWMMFIDSDEFFFGTFEDDLRVILTDYEKHGGVCANWLVFGSSGHTVRPEGLSIEAFLYRATDQNGMNVCVKSIIQPKCFQKYISSHLFDTMPRIVTEDHVEIGDHWLYNTDRRITHQVLRVNHYHVRSMEDWVARYRRERFLDSTPENEAGVKRSSREFQEKDYYEVLDTCILRFAGRLREAL
jgi:hypothetical protein